MKNFWEKHHEKIITLALFGVLFVGVMSVIALLGGAVMRVFGFQYRSAGSVILFFAIATVISYPINLFAETLPKVLLHHGKIPKSTAIPLYLLLDTIATALGLKLVDYFMESVSATDFAIMVVSLLLALAGVRDIDEKPKGVE